MTIIEFSPLGRELFPAIMAVLVAAGGWGLAKYTGYVARRDRAARLKREAGE